MKKAKVAFVGLAIAVVATLALRAADQSVTNSRKANWEYWVGEGDSSVVKRDVQQKLNEGFQIEHLLSTAKGGGFGPNVFAVLKREK